MILTFVQRAFTYFIKKCSLNSLSLKILNIKKLLAGNIHYSMTKHRTYTISRRDQL